MSSYLNKKRKNFFVFKQIKVIIPHSQSHSLDFFLLHLLPLTVVFYFFAKMMWKFQFWCNWKQGALPVATNPCVSVLYHCGTATGQAPRQMTGSSQRNTTPRHRQSPPPALPYVSQELKPAKARCSGFLTSGWKNLLLTLTEKKNNRAIILSYRSYHSEICVSVYSFVLHRSMWKQ